MNLGKGHLNGACLGKLYSSNQVVGVWYVKEDDYAATCKLCSKDINVEYMGFLVLKQHCEKTEP